MLVPDALSRLVRSATDEELEKEWVQGEHWSTVPQFRHIFEQVYPEVKIQDEAPGTDTFEKPEAGISSVQAPVTYAAAATRGLRPAEDDEHSEVFADPDADWAFRTRANG